MSFPVTAVARGTKDIAAPYEITDAYAIGNLASGVLQSTITGRTRVLTPCKSCLYSPVDSTIKENASDRCKVAGSREPEAWTRMREHPGGY